MKRLLLCTLALMSGLAQADWPFPKQFGTPSTLKSAAVQPEQLLVKLNAYATDAEMLDLLQVLSAQGAQVVGGSPRLGMIQIEAPNLSSLKAALASHGAVSTAEYNIQLNLHSTVDGAMFQTSQAWWYDAVRAEPAWFVTRGNPAVKVAVVDSGMSASQQVMSTPRLEIVARDGTNMPVDDTTTNHGTSVMTFAAGYVDDAATQNDEVNGLNVRGINHDSPAVSVDVFNGVSFTVADLLQGVQTAVDKGAKVVNVSAGYDGSGCSDQPCRYNMLRVFRELFDAAAVICRDEGALLFLTSGNLALKEDNIRFNTSSSFDDVDANRRWDSNVVVVGASRTNSFTNAIEDSSSSNMGDATDIMAPGQTTCPAQGGNPDLSCGYTGTSFASPIVMGVASLAASIDTTFRPAEIRRLTLDTASPLVVTDHDPKTHPDAGAAVASAELLSSANYDVHPEVVFNTSGQTATITIHATTPAAGLFAGDVMFLQDVSQSQHDDIDALQAKFSALITDLDTRGIDFNYGVAGFSDFPSAPYGDAADEAFKLLTGITSDRAEVNTQVNQLDMPLLSGGDAKESQYEAIRQLLTGTGVDQNGNDSFADAGDIRPSATGWRLTAKKIIVLSTDAPFHNNAPEAGYPGASKADALTLLGNEDATIIGLDSHNTKGDLKELTDATGGDYFRTTATPNSIADAIEAAIDNMQDHVDVTAEIVAGDQFVTSISPASHTGLLPSSPVTFTVQLANPYADLSSSAPHQNHDLVFWIRGNGAVFQRVYVPIRITD